MAYAGVIGPCRKTYWLYRSVSDLNKYTWDSQADLKISQLWQSGGMSGPSVLWLAHTPGGLGQAEQGHGPVFMESRWLPGGPLLSACCIQIVEKV